VKATLSGPAPAPAERFGVFLRRELARRCAGNPRYSLRAFARRLAIDHSTLSQILRGKRAVTAETIERLGIRLDLDVAAREAFARQERWAAAPQNDPSPGIATLALDTAAVIAEWYHHAILELLRVEGFRPDSRWIARVLGITVDEVNVALQRLLRLGLLRMEGQLWIDLAGDAGANGEEFGVVAVERLLDESRRLALGALHGTSLERQIHGSVTLTVSTRRLAVARDLIARLQSELAAALAGDAPDEVYRLEVSLYPITKLDHEEKESHGLPRPAVADSGQRS